MRRVTVTLPDEVVEEIDRREANRSRFVLEATLDALERARIGEREWLSLAADEDRDLLDPTGGTRVCWVPGTGWIEVER
jgi:Arc/MetJ-type ribon-helix-helix transcriptional regulator